METLVDETHTGPISAKCVICGGKNFTLAAGFYFCVECGTQSQDIREVELDGPQNFDISQKVIRDRHVIKTTKHKEGKNRRMSFIIKFKIIKKMSCN